MGVASASPTSRVCVALVDSWVELWLAAAQSPPVEAVTCAIFSTTTISGITAPRVTCSTSTRLWNEELRSGPEGRHYDTGQHGVDHTPLHVDVHIDLSSSPGSSRTPALSRA